MPGGSGDLTKILINPATHTEFKGAAINYPSGEVVGDGVGIANVQIDAHGRMSWDQCSDGSPFFAFPVYTVGNSNVGVTTDMLTAENCAAETLRKKTTGFIKDAELITTGEFTDKISAVCSGNTASINVTYDNSHTNTYPNSGKEEK